MKPQITIRIGANNDDVTIDGVKIDRSTLTRQQKAYVRQKVVINLFGKDAYTNA